MQAKNSDRFYKALGKNSYLCLFSLLFAVALPIHVLAEVETAQKTQEISDRVMSPFCPGRTLSACPSDQARDLRTTIGGWLEEGYTETAVENRLQMMYGKEVFGVPPHSGVGLLGWYMPVIFSVLMLCFLAFLLRNMRKRSVDPLDPELIKEAERALEQKSYSQG